MRYKLIFLSIVIFFIQGCGSSKRLSQESFHQALINRNYQTLSPLTLKDSYLSSKENKLLFYLELGKIHHLNHNYDSSNYYLNLADNFIEDKQHKPSIGLSDATLRYDGNELEQMLIHYYKALNYVFLNKLDESIVEVKRMTIKEGELEDKQLVSACHTIKGLFYDVVSDYNNAFIAYRNAFEIHTKYSTKTFGFEIKIPNQLKQDILRTASLAGLTEERTHFEKLFNLTYTPDTAKYGSLVFIWENGWVSQKRRERLSFFIHEQTNGISNAPYYINSQYNISVPCREFSSISSLDKQTTFNRNITVSIPCCIYASTVPEFKAGQITTTNEQSSYYLEKIIAVDDIMQKTHDANEIDRISSAINSAVRSRISENEDKLKKGEAINTKNIKIGSSGAFLGDVDTRIWQSLPYDVQYTRIPLNQDTATFFIKTQGFGGAEAIHSFSITAKEKPEVILFDGVNFMPIIKK